jgi:hypothetical protein
VKRSPTVLPKCQEQSKSLVLFGRQPTAQGPDGRDHNITGYPMFLAGAGVK